jgi:Uma2 family endonuclease
MAESAGWSAMATQPQNAPFTVADYRELGEGPPYHQLIEGELFMSPSPNLYHQILVANLHLLLAEHVKRRQLGLVLTAPMDVFLDDINVYQPDLLFVSNERRELLQDDGIHGAPDLVVEILSPSTARLDKRKRANFAKHGTREFWQVDPVLQQIQRFDFARDTAKPIQIVDEGETLESPLFPGLAIATAEIFKR